MNTAIYDNAIMDIMNYILDTEYDDFFDNYNDSIEDHVYYKAALVYYKGDKKKVKDMIEEELKILQEVK